MGASLNPRISSLDLKMFTEARLSWILLFILTASAGVKQYETYGYISKSMWFMILAHFLYTNAIMKVCIILTIKGRGMYYINLGHFL
jgi:Delta24(24(1))-sterol reductase